jgi:hypothetical protein
MQLRLCRACDTCSRDQDVTSAHSQPRAGVDNDTVSSVLGSISDLAAPDRAVGQLAILHLLESIAHSQGQEVATDPGRVISVQPLLFKAQFLDAQRAKAIAFRSIASWFGLDIVRRSTMQGCSRPTSIWVCQQVHDKCARLDLLGRQRQKRSRGPSAAASGCDLRATLTDFLTKVRFRAH